MTGFVPHGYLALGQALDRVAQSLAGAEWQGTVLTDGEQAALAQQERASKLLRAYSAGGRGMGGGSSRDRRPDRQKLEEKAADTPQTKAAKEKLKRGERLRIRAMEPLRQALFAGEVSAFILSEGGTMSDLPTRVWGAAHAVHVFDTGKAAFLTRRAPYDGSSTVEGRVLLDEASFGAWLTPSPARETAAPAAEAAAAAEAPDPYNTGFPGRPTIRHLIEEEFRRRVEERAALSVLTMEARELHAWAMKEHPRAPTPTVKTIANLIRVFHRRYVEVARE